MTAKKQPAYGSVPNLKRPRKGSVKVSEFWACQDFSSDTSLFDVFPPLGAHRVNGQLYVSEKEFDNALGLPPRILMQAVTGKAKEWGLLSDPDYTLEGLIENWLATKSAIEAEILDLWKRCHTQHLVRLSDVERLLNSFDKHWRPLPVKNTKLWTPGKDT
jgi:hypothetical protein